MLALPLNHFFNAELMESNVVLALYFCSDLMNHKWPVDGGWLNTEQLKLNARHSIALLWFFLICFKFPIQLISKIVIELFAVERMKFEQFCDLPLGNFVVACNVISSINNIFVSKITQIFISYQHTLNEFLPPKYLSQTW